MLFEAEPSRRIAANQQKDEIRLCGVFEQSEAPRIAEHFFGVVPEFKSLYRVEGGRRESVV
jgi:hypothetical protein